VVALGRVGALGRTRKTGFEGGDVLLRDLTEGWATSVGIY